MKNPIQHITLLASIALLLMACKKDEPTNTAPEATEAALTLHLDAEFNGKTLVEDSVYTTASGTDFKLTGLAFYVNDIRLIRQDDSEYSIPQSAFYVQLAGGGGMGGNHKTQHTEDGSYVNLSLGNVPKGNYKGLRLRVGNQAMSGHNGPGGTEGKVQPTDFADGHALAAQTPSMWWAWGTGYIYFRLDGALQDSSATTVSVHLGTGDLIRDITVFENRPFVVGDGANELTLNFDLYSLFDGINLATEYSTHSMGTSKPLAERYGDNLNSAFFLPLLP